MRATHRRASSCHGRGTRDIRGGFSTAGASGRFPGRVRVVTNTRPEPSTHALSRCARRSREAPRPARTRGRPFPADFLIELGGFVPTSRGLAINLARISRRHTGGPRPGTVRAKTALVAGTSAWAHLGLNRGPLACEASALPLSYAPGTRTVAAGSRRSRGLGARPGACTLDAGRVRVGVEQGPARALRTKA